MFGTDVQALLIEVRLNVNFDIRIIRTTIMMASIFQYIPVRFEGDRMSNA